MMIHLYLNEKRIKDIAFQINKDSLNQITNKNAKIISMKSEIKGGLPTWLEFIGFKGDGMIGGEGKLQFSKEVKPTSIEYFIIEFIKDKLFENDFNFVTSKTNFSEINKDLPIFRVQSEFKPLVEGHNGLERINNFQEMDYVEWIGEFENYKIKFGTSKESYVGRTAIFQCLNSQSKKMKIDFFGTLSTFEKDFNDRKQIINLLPLFFGVDLSL